MSYLREKITPKQFIHIQGLFLNRNTKTFVCCRNMEFGGPREGWPLLENEKSKMDRLGVDQTNRHHIKILTA